MERTILPSGDFETLREASQDRPLDPDSQEARDIEARIADIESDNLARMARRSVDSRVQMFRALVQPA